MKRSPSQAAFPGPHSWSHWAERMTRSSWKYSSDCRDGKEAFGTEALKHAPKNREAAPSKL